MDCGKADRRMYRYLDGEITFWRRWRISRHLDKCPPCAHGYEFEVELREVIATRCRDQVPDELKARIQAALDRACMEHQQSQRAQTDGGRAERSSDRGVE